MMSFGLKNVGATYQRLGRKMIADLIMKWMEIYVEMLVKSLKVDDHVMHLKEAFHILQRYRMRLNLLNCAFVWFSTNFWNTWSTKEVLKSIPRKFVL